MAACLKPAGSGIMWGIYQLTFYLQSTVWVETGTLGSLLAASRQLAIYLVVKWRTVKIGKRMNKITEKAKEIQ